MRFNVAQMLDPSIAPLLERAMLRSGKASESTFDAKPSMTLMRTV
jgi:hypothetical protein